MEQPEPEQPAPREPDPARLACLLLMEGCQFCGWPMQNFNATKGICLRCKMKNTCCE